MKRSIVLTAAVLLTLSMVAPAWGSGSADRQSTDVLSFEDGSVTGDARLARTDTGVTYNLRTSGLTGGDAVSIWWVIFNNPEYCLDDDGYYGGDCELSDLFLEKVDAAVQAAGGHVIGNSGRAGFAGHLNEGQITNEHPMFLDGPGLTDARGAEIHLVVRTHGPVIPGMNHAMFNSFEVGCDVNHCEDVQFAVFK
jgi:hypothetical protein